jgi:hypothetical protein
MEHDIYETGRKERVKRKAVFTRGNKYMWVNKYVKEI